MADIVEVLDPRLAGLEGGIPLTVEWRFPLLAFTGEPFTGELPEGSRLRENGPVFRLGGSGRGRPLEGVLRLEGELVAAYILGRTWGLMPVRNSCFNAS